MARTQADFDAETEGYLSVKDYAEKYGIADPTVPLWCNKGYLAFKMVRPPDGVWPDKKRRYVLNLPYTEHPGWSRKAVVARKKVRSTYDRPPENLGRVKDRKKKLNNIYLPKFLERADPGQIYFLTKELYTLFDIDYNTIARWVQWGLKRLPISDELRKGYGKAATFTSQNHCYKRTDIVRFLKGQWDPNDIQKTLDDFSEKDTGRIIPDGYYDFSIRKKYSQDVGGWLQWLKDVDLQFLDKNRQKYVTFRPWEKQVEATKRAFTLNDSGDFKYKLSCLCWPRGEGKCHSKGTLVIDSQGNLVKVEDIRPGDLLMGPDSKPRRVRALGRGQEEMYKVTPFKGEPFVCNGSHILAMEHRTEIRDKNRRRVRGVEKVELSLDDYMATSRNFKERTYLYKVPINWPEKQVSISPRFLGMWLADGTSRGHINITLSIDDEELIVFLYTLAFKVGARFTATKDKRGKACLIRLRGLGGDALREEMRAYNVFGNKHVPHDYKATSREVRLELLAGFIDGDGAVNSTGYVVLQKNKRLSDDIAFIARSLGFECQVKQCTKEIKSMGFKGQYYRISINGDCSEIPILLPRKKVPVRKINKNVLRTRIKSIEPQGVGDYYGFTLDGDGLFLLSDFIVTHNTILVATWYLFRFFTRYGEQIVLSGNSKDQSTFTHFETAKGMVNNTPRLAKMKEDQGLQVKEKYIALERGPKDRVCEIRAIPTSSGLLSNITCAVFTEFQDLEDRPFFTKLHGSLRGTFSAQTYIDCTVAPKGHPIEKMYQANLEGTDPLTYFDWYGDKNYNPAMTQDQLDHFRANMLESDYNKYFRNIWEAATGTMFDPMAVKEMGYLGNGGHMPDIARAGGVRKNFRELVAERGHILKRLGPLEAAGVDASKDRARLKQIDETLVSVESLYSIPATKEQAEDICNILGTGDLIIGVGLDRARSLSKNPDRTVLSCVGRAVIDIDTSYYFLLDLAVPTPLTISLFSEYITEWSVKYGWVDRLVLEAYQAEDLHNWCVENGYIADIREPTYKAQYSAFARFQQLVNQGFFKTPPVPYYVGEKGVLFPGVPCGDYEDIVRQEMGVFIHTYRQNSVGMVTSGVFGSPEKKMKYGTKDDAVYSIAWGIDATQIDENEAVPKKGGMAMLPSNVNKDVVGSY